jgi:protease II
MLGFTNSNKLCGEFQSAGGLIGGVMANAFPDLFAAIIMRFIDYPEVETLNIS